MTAHILVVGESLVDVVIGPGRTSTEHAGGSSANAAVALGRLGNEVWLGTALGDDTHGRLLLDHLSANGVRLAGEPTVLARTGTAVATLAVDGSASYEFDIEWRLPTVTLPPGVEVAAVVFGSLGAALAPGADDVARLVESRRNGALTVLDLNARPAITGTGPEVVARAEQMAALADVIKASDEDLETLWPGRDHADVFHSAGTSALVVTQGAQGARCLAAGVDVEVGSPSTRVVDTIGAGDTVTGAVVDALLRLGVGGPAAGSRMGALGSEQWRGVLDFATRAAAITVSRAGADPPWLRELD